MDLLEEEAHEAGVERNKIRRAGEHFIPFNNPDDPPFIPGGQTYGELYRSEVYDMLTIIDLMFERNMLSAADYASHKVRKLEKMKRWAAQAFED
jgi:hypothetical protein